MYIEIKYYTNGIKSTIKLVIIPIRPITIKDLPKKDKILIYVYISTVFKIPNIIPPSIK